MTYLRPSKSDGYEVRRAGCRPGRLRQTRNFIWRDDGFVGRLESAGLTVGYASGALLWLLPVERFVCNGGRAGEICSRLQRKRFVISTLSRLDRDQSVCAA